MAKIDFIMVGAFHRNWMIALKAFLKGNGGLTEVQALSHEDCDFGKWLYSDGMFAYGKVFEFRRLEKVHVRLHEHVRAYMDAKQSEDEMAQEHLLLKIEAASEEILGLMKKMQNSF
ncbi:MAG: CZB domain-containing protein [Candidatus Omnitrophica bacterium]|nr:CZB domain-containing protein [Candidatus Omnitrophota bacterium]